MSANVGIFKRLTSIWMAPVDLERYSALAKKFKLREVNMKKEKTIDEQFENPEPFEPKEVDALPEEDPKAPPVPEKEEKEAKLPEIQLSEEGALKPKDITQLRAMCSLYKQSTALAPELKNNATLLMALQISVTMKVNPVVILNGLMVINNRFRFHSALPSNLCMKSGKLESIKTFCIDKEYKEISLANKNLLEAPIAGVCHTLRAGDDTEMETFFTIEDAKNAGLMGRTTYKGYLKQMLMARARSANLEYYYADVLGGLSDFDNAPVDNRTGEGQRDPNQMLEEKDVTPFEEPLEGGAL